jgi:hypothetical protein
VKISYPNIYPRVNLILTIVLPVIGILQSNTTVFYIVYLYWWQELIASLLDGWYYRKKDNTGTTILSSPLSARLFLLFIYFVFIVVLFGVMSSWGNTPQMRINLLVFLFRDWFFNINLIGILLNEWWLRQNTSVVRHNFDNPFSGRMMVMHIAIIAGGFVTVFANNRFPNIVSSDNIWLSVLAAMPFLLLKALMIRWEEKAK